MTAIVLLVAGVSAGAVFYSVKKQVPIVSYQREMAFVLDAMAHQDRRFVVVVGDSLTQKSNMPETVCGIPLINAGFGGARASSLIPFAEEMTALKISPALIIVALGVNDSVSGYRTDFQTNYRTLIESLPQTKLAVVTLPPFQDASYEKRLDRDRISLVDGSIRQLAAAKNLRVIDLSRIGISPTEDGIHPTAEGYKLRNDAILSAIGQLLSCNVAGYAGEVSHH